ncbi:MAG TPA: RNA 3'-terminal phosphate cyclase [Burkholderiales bacterium]|nr:RNA 3'-terminal phosphate cyclase [Burkholderiales bacterium]
MLEIDGSHGEGGGQLLRTAAALAALTGTAVRIRAVRAGRGKPGLAAQHLAALRAVVQLCRARAEGLALGSGEVVLEPGTLRGGSFAFDVGTAGSVTLVLQALLPVMIAARADIEVRVTGGTDVRAAPPLDYLREVLLPLLARMGVRAQLAVARRGYYPRGGGQVEMKVRPAALRSLRLTAPGRLLRVEGCAHVAHLPAQIAQRMRSAALERLGPLDVPLRCDSSVLEGERAIGQGGAVALWAQCEHTVLGAARVAERGVRAEALGEAAGAELAADLAAGATLDVHAADQLPVYLALAGGESSFVTRELTSHARTAMWLIEQFLPVRFAVAPCAAGVRVDAAPL